MSALFNQPSHITTSSQGQRSASECPFYVPYHLKRTERLVWSVQRRRRGNSSATSHTNLCKSHKKQLVVAHSQRWQRGLLPILFNPVHVSLWRRSSITLHIYAHIECFLTVDRKHFPQPSFTFAWRPCLSKADLSSHGKNVCMWRTDQRLTCLHGSTCLICRLHCRAAILLVLQYGEIHSSHNNLNNKHIKAVD